MVLGLKPMGKLATFKKKTKYQTEPRSCMVLELKPMGKLATSKKKKTKYQTKPRSYMVLGLKPMGKLATSRKKLSTRQNQGLAWSSDSNLWGNQLLPKKKRQVLDVTKVLHGPRTQTYGETSYFQEKIKYQAEPTSCMVLELKPIRKLSTSKKKN